MKNDFFKDLCEQPFTAFLIDKGGKVISIEEVNNYTKKEIENHWLKGTGTNNTLKGLI